jgi:hypothetical protein
MSRKTEGDIVEFGDIFESMPKGSKNLGDEMKGKTFIITNVEYGVGKYGEFAVVTVDDVLYRTSSQVLLGQLKAVEAHIKQNGVRVTLRQPEGKKYLTFERE